MTGHSEDPRSGLKAACAAARVGSIRYEQIRRNFSQNQQPALPDIAVASAKRQRPAVEMSGPDQPVVVLGKDHGVLRPKPYAILRALWEFDEDGIPPKQLDKVTGVPYARERVRAMRAESPQLRELIETPGKGFPGSQGKVRLTRRWID
jgi:hypothetical protein